MFWDILIQIQEYLDDLRITPIPDKAEIFIPLDRFFLYFQGQNL